LGRRVGLERAQDLDAGQARHEQVEEDEIGRLAASQAQSFFAVHGRDDGEAALPETRFAGSTEEAIVLDEQDLLRAGCPHATPLLGSVNTNVRSEERRVGKEERTG